MENFVVNNSANTTENNTNENIFENTIGSAKTNVFALPTFDLQRFEKPAEDPGMSWDANSATATVYSSTGLDEAFGFNGPVTVSIVSDVTVSATVTVDSTKVITFTAPGNLTANPTTTPMFELDTANESLTFSSTSLMNSVVNVDGTFSVSVNSSTGITSITGMNESDDSAIYNANNTAYTIKNIGSNQFTVVVDKDGTYSDVTLQYTVTGTVNSATNVVDLTSTTAPSWASTVAVVATNEAAVDSLSEINTLFTAASNAGYTVSTIDFENGTITKSADADGVTTYTVNLGAEADMATFTIDSATYINSATALSATGVTSSDGLNIVVAASGMTVNSATSVFNINGNKFVVGASDTNITMNLSSGGTVSLTTGTLQLNGAGSNTSVIYTSANDDNIYNVTAYGATTAINVTGSEDAANEKISGIGDNETFGLTTGGNTTYYAMIGDGQLFNVSGSDVTSATTITYLYKSSSTDTDTVAFGDITTTEDAYLINSVTASGTSYTLTIDPNTSESSLFMALSEATGNVQADIFGFYGGDGRLISTSNTKDYPLATSTAIDDIASTTLVLNGLEFTLDDVYSAAKITATTVEDTSNNRTTSAAFSDITLISGNTTFIVDGSTAGAIHLENVSSVTLTNGTVAVESSDLTVSFTVGETKYAVTSPDADDFTVTFGSTASTARIAGITEGESFVLYTNGASTTYTMDAVGVYAVKDESSTVADNAAQQRVLKGTMGNDSGVYLSDLTAGAYVIATDDVNAVAGTTLDDKTNLTVNRYTALPANSAASVYNTDKATFYGYLSNTSVSNTYVFTSVTSKLSSVTLDFTAESATEVFTFQDYNGNKYSAVDSATATVAMIGYNSGGTFNKLTVSDGNLEISGTSLQPANGFELYKDASLTYSGTTYTSTFDESLENNLVLTGTLGSTNINATNFVYGASFQVTNAGSTTTYTNITDSGYSVMKRVDVEDAGSTISTYFIYSSTSLVSSGSVDLTGATTGLQNIGSSGLLIAEALDNEEALTVTYDATAKNYAGKVYVDYLNDDVLGGTNAFSTVYAQVSYNNGTYTVENKNGNTTIATIDFGTSLASGETVNAATFAPNTHVTFEATKSSLYTINGSKYIAGTTSNFTTVDGVTTSDQAGLLDIITSSTSKSALYAGLVKLTDASSSVTVAEAAFASETLISVTSFGTDSEITVSASGNAGVASMSVSALDEGAAFSATVGGVTYNFQMTSKGLIKTNATTGATSYIASSSGNDDPSDTYQIFTDADQNVLYVQTSDTFVITGEYEKLLSESNTKIIYASTADASGTVYGELMYDSTTGYFLDTEYDAASNITLVSIDAAAANSDTTGAIILDIDSATVTTASTDGTFIINGSTFNAVSSPLTLISDYDLANSITEVTSIYDGTISIPQNTDAIKSSEGQSVTTQNGPVTVSFESGTVLSVLATTLSDSITLTVVTPGDTATETAVYNVINNNYYVARAEAVNGVKNAVLEINGSETVVLNADADWLGFASQTVTSAATINFVASDLAVISASDTAYAGLLAVDNKTNITNVYARLTYDSSTGYAIASETAFSGTDTTFAITGMVASDTVTVADGITAHVQLNVFANNAQVTVNGVTYTHASTTSLTLAVAGSSTASTLYDGTVSINRGDEGVTLTESGTVQIDPNDTTYSNSITVTASDGTLTSVGGLNTGETFTVKDESATVTYTVAFGGTMMLRTDSSNVYQISELDTAATGANSETGIFNFTSASWTAVTQASNNVITVKADDITVLESTASDSGITYVDNVSAEANVIYGTLRYDSSENISGTFGRSSLESSTGIRSLAAVVAEPNVTVGFDSDIVAGSTTLVVSGLTVNFSSGTAMSLTDVAVGAEFTYGAYDYNQTGIGLIWSNDTASDTYFALKNSADVDNFTFAQITSDPSRFQIAAVDTDENSVKNITVDGDYYGNFVSGTTITYVNALNSSASLAYVTVESSTSGLTLNSVDPTFVLSDYTDPLANFDVNVVNQTLAFNSDFLNGGSNATLSVSTLAANNASGVTVGLASGKVDSFDGLAQGDIISVGSGSSSTSYAMSLIGLTYSETATSNTFLLLSTMPKDNEDDILYDRLLAPTTDTTAQDAYIIQRIQSSTAAIVINSATTFASSTLLVDATGSAASKAYATVEQSGTTYTFTTNDLTANYGIEYNSVTSVALTGVQGVFTNDFLNTTITANNGSEVGLQVTSLADGSETFTVNAVYVDSNTHISVDGASAITLTNNGYIDAAINQTVTIGTGAEPARAIQVTNAVEGDTTGFTVQRTSASAAVVTGLSASGATVSIINLANSNVYTSNQLDSTTEVTYAFGTNGDQTFKIIGDPDGVRFTVDSDGYVTTITGLDEAAQLTVVDNDKRLTSINGYTQRNFDYTTGTLTFIGLNSGNSAIQLKTSPVYFEISENGRTTTAYYVSSTDSTNPGIGSLGESQTSTASTMGGYNSGTGVFTLGSQVSPSHTYPVTLKSNYTGNTVTILGNTANNNAEYVLTMSSDLVIQIYGPSAGSTDLALRLMTVEGTSVNAATTRATSGNLTIPQGFSLVVKGGNIDSDLTITASATSSETVVFSESGIALGQVGAVVTNADSDAGTFALNGTTAGAYTINGLVYTSAAIATSSDTVAIGASDVVTLTTTYNNTAAAGNANALTVASSDAAVSDTTFVLTSLGTSDTAVYHVGDNYYAVVENATIAQGTIEEGTFRILTSNASYNNLTASGITVTSTSTNADFDVVVSGSALISVGDIDNGESFTVTDSASGSTIAGVYTKNAAGLFLGTSTSITSDSKLVTAGITADSDGDSSVTYTFATAEFADILLLTNNTRLAMPSEVTDGTVVFNTNATQQVATFAVDASDTNVLTLTKDSDATVNITSVTGVASGTTLMFSGFTSTISSITTTGSATIGAESGTEIYNATTGLVVNLFNGTLPRLQSGTVVVSADEGADSDVLIASNTNNAVTTTFAVDSGTVTVSVNNGSITTLTELNAGDSFSITPSNGSATSYAMATAGLLNTTAGKIYNDSLGKDQPYTAAYNTQFTTTSNVNYWLGYLTLENSDTALVLSDDTITGRTIVLDEAADKYVANITYASNTITVDNQAGTDSTLATIDIASNTRLVVSGFSSDVAVTASELASSTSVYVNGIQYTGAGTNIEVSAATATTVSTLTAGSVSLLTNGISVTTTGGIKVTADTTSNVGAGQGFVVNVAADDSGTEVVSVGNIAVGEKFTVTVDGSDTQYTMTDLGLVDGDGNLYAQYTADSDAVVIPTTATTSMIAVETGDVLNLDAASTTGITYVVVDSTSAPTKKYGEVTYAVDDASSATTYAFTFGEDVTSGATIATVNVPSTVTNANVNGLTTATVATLGESGTFNIGSDDYVAQTTLTIDVVDGASTLNNGTVKLDATKDVVTSIGNTIAAVTADASTGITVQVDSASSGTTIGALDAGSDSFTVTSTVDGSEATVTYTMTNGLGLYSSEKVLFENVTGAEGANTFKLGDTTGVDVIEVSDSKLTLADATDAGNYVVVAMTNEIPSAKYGTLAYTAATADAFATYALDGTDSATAIAEIAVPAAADGMAAGATITGINFASKVTATVPGTYTIGETIYKSSGTTLEIATTAASNTLTTGTVILGDGAEGTLNLTADSEPTTVKATETSGDGVLVNVENGVVSAITGLSDGGSVVYGNYTFTRTGDKVALVETTTVEGSETTTTTLYDYDYTAIDDSASNLLDLVGVAGETYVQITDTIDLALGQNVSGAKVVYGTSDEYIPANVVATLTKTASAEGGSVDTYKLEQGAGYSAEVGVSGSDLTVANMTVTTDFAANLVLPKATSETAPKYTVNGIEFVPSTESDLTLALTNESATLEGGTVVLDSSKETAPDSVTLSTGATVTANGTIIKASATGGALTSVSGIDSATSEETFTITGVNDTVNGTYKKTAAGLFYSTDNGTTYTKEVTAGFEEDEANANGILNINDIVTSDFLTVVAGETEGSIVLALADNATAIDTDAQNGIGVYSADLSTKLATLKYESSTFNLTKDADAVSGLTITLDNNNPNVITNFAATITTAEVSAVTPYTVNNDTYAVTAQSTISVLAGEGEGEFTTALASGSVQLENGSTDINSVTVADEAKTNVEITGGDSIIVNVSEDGALESVESLGTDDEFVVTNGDYAGTYTATAVGFFKTTTDSSTEPPTETIQLLEDSGSITEYTFADENTWTNVLVVDTNGAIVIDSDTTYTTYVDSDMATIVATYDNSDKSLKAGESIANAATITVNGVAVDFEVGENNENFVESTINLNDAEGNAVASFKVADTSPSFVVDATADVTVKGAEAEITLLSGSITVEDTQIVTAGDTKFNANENNNEIGNYTVAIDDSGNVTMTIGAIEAGQTATFDIQGNVTINATTELGGNTSNVATYVFGDQEFAVKGDAGTGLTFTLVDGKVTEIANLDVDSIIEVVNNDTTSAYDVKINNQEFSIEAENSASYVGIGAEEGENATQLLDDNIYIVITEAGEVTVDGITIDEGTGVATVNGSPVTITEGTTGGTISYTKAEDGTITLTLTAGLIPSEDNNTVVLVNESSSPAVVLQNANAVPYVNGLSIDGVGVYITSSGTLKLVETNEDNEIVDVSAVPASGSITLPANMTLTVVDTFTIASGTETGGEIEFSDATNIALNGEGGMTVANAPAGINFTLNTAEGLYSVNTTPYTSTGDAVVVATEGSSNLYGGTVILNDSSTTVTVADNQVVTANAAAAAEEGASATVNPVEVTATEGALTSVGALMSGDSFNIGDTEYNMSAIGLFEEATEGNIVRLLVNADLEEEIEDEVVVGYAYYPAETTDSWLKAKETANNAIDLTAEDVKDDIYFVTEDRDAIVAVLDYTAAEGEGTVDNYTLIAGAGLATEDVAITFGNNAELTTTFDATVTTTGTATVNGSTFTMAEGDGLTIAATFDAGNVDEEIDPVAAATLTEGTVTVTDDEALNTTDGKSVHVDEDSNGVKVVVAEGTATSITGLDVSGTVTYGDEQAATTYEMYNGRLVVKDSDGTRIYDGEAYNNTFDLLGEYTTDAINYRQLVASAEDEEATLDTMTFEADDTAVVFGLSSDYVNDDVVAKLTVETTTDEENGETSSTYTLTAENTDNIPENAKVDATAISDIKLDVVGFGTEVEVTAKGDVEINNVAFDATEAEGELTIQSSADGATALLTTGNVRVSSMLTTSGNESVALTAKEGAEFDEEDEDSGIVLVEVVEGKVTSITGLGSEEEVEYTYVDDEGNTVIETYNFFDNGVISKTVDGTTTYFAGNDEATNLLDLTGEGNVAYVQIVDDELNVDSGTALFTDEITTIYYGTDETYAGEHIIELKAKESEDEEESTGYELTAVDGAEIPENLVVNAGDATELTIEFDANVTKTGDITVNTILFDASEDEGNLEISATNGGASLTNGTVIVTDTLTTTLFETTSENEDGEEETTSTGGQTVEYTAPEGSEEGNGVIVTVTDGVVGLISDIDEGEIVTVDEDTYTRAVVGIVWTYTDENNNEIRKVLMESDEVGSEAIADVIADVHEVDISKEDNTWARILTLTNNNTTLDLSTVDEELFAVLDSDMTQQAATVAYTAATEADEETGTDATPVKYTVNKTEGYDSDITTVVLGAESAELEVTFATTVQTTAGEDGTFSTYKVNGDTYAPATGALEIATEGSEGDTTLTNGSVIISVDEDNYHVTPTNQETITAGTGNFIVTVADGEWTSIAGIDSTAGESFTIDTDVYTASGIGVIVNGVDLVNGTTSATEAITPDDIAEENLSAIKVAENGEIVINSETLTRDDDDVPSVVFVDATDSSASKVYATYDSEGNLASNTDVADIATVTIEGIAVSVGAGFGADTEFSSTYTEDDEDPEGGEGGDGDDGGNGGNGGTVKFKVTNGAAFTVNGNVVSAENITLVEGKLSGITADQTIATETDDTSVKVTADGIAYAIELSQDEDTGANVVALTGIDREATVELFGMAGSTAQTVDDTTATIYTFGRDGDQTFTITGDADGVTFTVDADGYVTDITGLAADATILVDSANDVTVNDVTFSKDEDEENYTVVGTKEGTSAAKVFTGSSFLIEFDGSDIAVYGVEDDGTINRDAAIESIASYDEGVITLEANIVPSDDVKVVVQNTSDTPVAVNTSNGNPYFANFNNENVSVQIGENGALNLVTTENDVVSDATADDVASLSGSITIPAAKTLTLADEYAITAGTDAAEITFDETIILNGAGTTVANAPEGATFTATAISTESENDEGETTTTYAAYTINDKSYSVVADATFEIGADGPLFVSGEIVVTSDNDVTASGGDTISFSGEEGNGVNVTAAEGEITNIGDIQSGESITLNGTTYTMTDTGIIKDGEVIYIWKDAETATDETFTADDLEDEEKWIGVIGLNETGTLEINSEVDATSGLLVVDSETAPTVRYGTLSQTDDGYTLTAEGATNTEEDTAITGISINGIKLSVGEGFNDIPVTANDAATFTVNGSFSVDATGDVVAISDTDEVTLTSGTISVPAGTTTIAGGTTITVGEGGYTVAFDTEVVVSAVNAGSVTIDGDATVQTTELAKEQVTYTFGTVEDGVVTKVAGLDIKALLTMTSATEVQVNEQDDDVYSGTDVKLVGTGSTNGENVAPLIEGQSFYVEITADEDGESKATVYVITDGVIAEEGYDDPEAYAQFFSFENNTLTINTDEGFIPSEENGNILAVANLTENEVAFDTYASGLTSLGDGLAVQVVSSNALKVVSASAGANLEDAAERPAEGSITVAADMTLTAGDVEIATAAETTVEFDTESVTVDGAGATVTGEGTFVLVGNSEDGVAYTLNENEVNVISTASITTGDDALTLNSGTIKTTGIAVADGAITIENDEDGVKVAVDENGTVTEISDLEDGVVVTYNGTTYTMSGTQLVVEGDTATRIYDNSSEETNILNLEDAEFILYIPVENDTIDMAAGVAGINDGATSAIYGTGETYNPDEVVVKN